jgi:hypothetical protein
MLDMKQIIFGLGLACLAAALPQSVDAYGVTDKKVTRLSDTLTMYTLTYEFGFLNADLWMPMAASKTLKESNQTTSVVLSTEPIEDGKYFVPMKKNGTFTLLVLEQHEVGESKGSVEVEKLPVILQKKNEEKVMKVFQDNELEGFVVGE